MLSAACGQSLSVDVARPATFSVGDVDTLILTEGHGRWSAQEVIADSMTVEVEDDGWFDVFDRSRQGARVEIYDDVIELPAGDAPGNAAYVRVDVLEWYAFDEEDVQVVTDADGRVIDEQWTVTTHAVALLSANLVAEDGRVLLLDAQYEGQFEGQFDESTAPIDFDDAIASAARAAVAELVADITPQRVRQSIRLDDSLEEHHGMLELARTGGLDVAIEQMSAWTADNAAAPQGHYNLGAFYDAAGDYDAALASYSDALRAGGESWYAKTRADCEQRQEWATQTGGVVLAD
jgi:tetratricopeptide (TPR) repeat protein